jgi:hypothetical protein
MISETLSTLCVNCSSLRAHTLVHAASTSRVSCQIIRDGASCEVSVVLLPVTQVTDFWASDGPKFVQLQ